ncbi:MAG: hypothetical protein RL641_409 [Candidatus Parcubacteria bacterium]|jgi:hypothetical protein
MRVRELFKSTGLTQSIGGTAVFLDRENCQIVNKTKNENSIVLHLKRESDGEEGRAHLRVKDEFESLSSQLLNWAFASESIVGLTLNQLDDLETNFSVERIGGKLQLKA